MLRTIILFAFSSLFMALPTAGQQRDFLTSEIINLSFNTLKDFISLPNNARRKGEIEPNILFLEKEFKKRSFTTKRLTHDQSVVLFSEFQVSAELPTLLFYFHADGQPVEPSQWNQKNPYEIVVKSENGTVQEWRSIFKNPNPDWRLYGRSTSDDKGPIVMLLSAMDALKFSKEKPKFNLKVIIDFEEESGSPHIGTIIKKNAALLKTKGVIIFDGPMHFSNQPTISYGSRGIAAVSLIVFGSKKPLHSGHYGNYAPNPAFKLARLLASMKDKNGKVLISGLNENVRLNNADRQIMEKVPDDPKEICKRIGIAKGYQTYQDALQYSSFDIVGMSSGWVGAQRRTIIPAQATVELSIRLVPQTDISQFLKNLRQHIVSQGYHIVKDVPTDAERAKYPNLISFEASISQNYQSWHTPLDSPLSLWLQKAISQVSEKPVVQIRMMGGSLPVAPLKSELKVDMLILPLVNPDNNQHSPNENIRIGHYINGIRSIISVLKTPLLEK